MKAMKQTNVYLKNNRGGSSNGYDGALNNPYVITKYNNNLSYHNLIPEWKDSYWDSKFKVKSNGNIYKLARTAQEEIDKTFWPGLNWTDWGGSTDICKNSSFTVTDNSVRFSIVYEVRYRYNEPVGGNAYGWINVCQRQSAGYGKINMSINQNNLGLAVGIDFGYSQISPGTYKIVNKDSVASRQYYENDDFTYLIVDLHGKATDTEVAVIPYKMYGPLRYNQIEIPDNTIITINTPLVGLYHLTNDGIIYSDLNKVIAGTNTANGHGDGFQPKHYCTVFNHEFGPGTYYIMYGGGKPQWSGLSGDVGIRITNKEYIPDTKYVECGWNFKYI